MSPIPLDMLAVMRDAAETFGVPPAGRRVEPLWRVERHSFPLGQIRPARTAPAARMTFRHRLARPPLMIATHSGSPLFRPAPDHAGTRPRCQTRCRPLLAHGTREVKLRGLASQRRQIGAKVTDS